MKSIAVASGYSQLKRNGVLDHWARKLLFKVLGNLTVGQLVIHDRGNVYTFGTADKTSDIHATIHVHNTAAYRQVLLGGTIGSGEAYMQGAWTSPDVLQVIRIFVANMNVIESMDSYWSRLANAFNAIKHRFRKNSKLMARKNIAAHYDLGNTFYQSFLDETMMYSSAIFDSEDTPLVSASTEKMRAICRQLALTDEDDVLEIGSGWGGMAIYMAKNYGCRVTSVTLSEEQYRYATEWAEREQVSDLVSFMIKDYRDVEGSFDKIVSIEMIEAVGYQYFDSFFRQCSQRLNPNGRMAIQAITIADQRFEREKDNADFIQTYIFPGGCLPSVTALTHSMAKSSDFQLVKLTDIGLHYARTLNHWRERFWHNIDTVKALGYEERFIRMWDFYLAYCEGGFRERVISTVQLVFSKPQCTWQDKP